MAANWESEKSSDHMFAAGVSLMIAANVCIFFWSPGGLAFSLIASAVCYCIGLLFYLNDR